MEIVADAEISARKIDLAGSGAFWCCRHRRSPVCQRARHVHVRRAAAVPDGATLVLQARATDDANVSAPATLTLTVHSGQSVTLPASVLLNAGDAQSVTVELVGGAGADVRVDFVSGDPAVATVTPSITFAAGETLKPMVVTGESGGTVQIAASVNGVPSGAMTATVRGGIVTGIVTDDHFRPVAGAEITVSGGVNLATVSASDGSYSVEGVAGPEVTVRSTDPQTHLYGFTTGQMARSLGHAQINVVMTTAASITGTVRERRCHIRRRRRPRRHLPVDRHELASGDRVHGRRRIYGFPFVQLGDSALDAIGRNGERARATIRSRRAQSRPRCRSASSARAASSARCSTARRAGERRRRHVPRVERGRLGAGGPGLHRRQRDVPVRWRPARPNVDRAGSGDRSGRLSVSGLMTRAGDTVTADIHLRVRRACRHGLPRGSERRRSAGATVTTTNYRRRPPTRRADITSTSCRSAPSASGSTMPAHGGASCEHDPHDRESPERSTCCPARLRRGHRARRERRRRLERERLSDRGQMWSGRHLRARRGERRHGHRPLAGRMRSRPTTAC